MIEVLTMGECPFCDEQAEILQKDFFNDEYVFVDSEAPEFVEHECAEMASQEGFPCVVIKDEAGTVRYAASGVHDSSHLRELERSIAFGYYFPDAEKADP